MEAKPFSGILFNQKLWSDSSPSPLSTRVVVRTTQNYHFFDAPNLLQKLILKMFDLLQGLQKNTPVSKEV